MRKLLSVILVLAMVLGVVGTAMAATVPTDVKGTSYETAVSRLAALNILKGYEDGTFKPGNNITRAEYAAVAVRALGLGDAAEQAKGATKFKDVPATHWASGYINIAVSRGIIKGYPDNTFKPEANVTVAEAIAMLVRVCGYEPSVVGEWPTNYLSKGAEIGLTKGIAVVPDIPATRGTVALMTANALTVDMMVQEFYGQLTSYKVVPGQNLLNTRLGVNEYKKSIIMSTPDYNLQGLKANEVKIHYQTSDKTWHDDKFTVIDGLDVNPLLGHEVTVWVNQDNEVINVIDTTDPSKIVSFKQSTSSSWTLADRVINNKGTSDTNDDATYYLSKDSNNNVNAVFYYNRAQESGFDPNKCRGSNLTLILDDNNKVRFVIAQRFEPSLVATAVNAAGSAPYIQYYNDNPSAKQTLALADKVLLVLDQNGAKKSLADIKPGSIFEVARNANANELIIRFNNTTVTGTVTKVVDMGYGYGDFRDWKVYIGDTGYTLGSGINASYSTVATAVKLSDDGLTGTLVNDNATAQSLNGYTGTFYLDPSGKIRLAAGKAMATPVNRGIVIGTESASPLFYGSTNDGYFQMVKILKVDGVTAVLPIDPKATDVNLLVPGAFVELSLNAKNYITDVNNMTGGDHQPDVNAATAINTDYDRITVNGHVYVITPDTKIINNARSGSAGSQVFSPVAISWGDLENSTGTLDVTVFADSTYPTRAKYIIVYGAGIGSATTKGVVLAEKWVSGNDKYVKVLADGVEKTYKYVGTDAAFNGWYVGEIRALTFDTDGNVSTIDDTTYVLTSVITGQVDPIGKTINVSGKLFYNTKDTIVYDYRSDLVKGDFSMIAEGQYVDIYTTSAKPNEIAYAVIQTDAKYTKISGLITAVDAGTYTISVAGQPYPTAGSSTWIFDNRTGSFASASWSTLAVGQKVDIYVNVNKGNEVKQIVIKP